MPAAKLLSVQGNGAPATAPAAGGATTPPDAAFDAILMLEELAAAAVGDIGIDTGAAELGADGAADDSTDGEDSSEDLDDPLAFLAGLLAVAPPTHKHLAVQGEGAGAGAVGSGLPPEPEASGLPFLPDAGNAATNTKAEGDAAAAARALAAQAALTVGDTRANDDSPGAATRGLDFFSHAARVAAGAEQPVVATHVHDPRWAEDFGTRIATLVNQRESMASISLTPLDLGPVDVSVTVRDSQATIHFGAAQAETRALIEASLPKLRELLAAQGFHLLDASVSQGFTRQSRPDAPSVPRPSSVEEVTAVTAHAIAMNGLLDTYA